MIRNETKTSRGDTIKPGTDKSAYPFKFSKVKVKRTNEKIIVIFDH